MTSWAGFWIGGGFALGCLFLTMGMLDLRAQVEAMIARTMKNAMPYFLASFEQARYFHETTIPRKAKRKGRASPPTGEPPK